MTPKKGSPMNSWLAGERAMIDRQMAEALAAKHCFSGRCEVTGTLLECWCDCLGCTEVFVAKDEEIGIGDFTVELGPRDLGVPIMLHVTRENGLVTIY